MNLILVDDEPAILDLLAAACEADGHVVKTFSSSSDALNYLRTHHTDLLITDIVMPPPDGFRLVSAARKAQPQLVAILVTGHVSRYSIEDVLACGGSDLLFKPLHLDELRLGVRLVDARRKAAKAGAASTTTREAGVSDDQNADGAPFEWRIGPTSRTNSH